MPYKTPNRTSEYIRSMLPCQSNGILKAMEDYAAEHKIPIILPEAAVFLEQLILLKKPLKILEVGTAIGYSGAIMLKNSHPKSTLTTIEIREDFALKAKEFFDKAKLLERVTVFLGDACEIVPLLDGKFDFIFVDGPKTRYIEFFPYLKRCLSNGGIMLCDNVLFNGMVAGEEDAGKKQNIASKLDEFLQTIMKDSSFSTSILPVGDGLSLSILRETND